MPAVDRLVLRFTAGAVALIAGTMLVAWLAGLDVAIRDDNLEPMGPLSCVGFLAGAAAAFAGLHRRAALSAAAGALALAVGVGGLADNLFNGGRWLNDTLFAVDAKVAVLTALALVLLGGAWVLGERAWPVPRALASGAALLGLAALDRLPARRPGVLRAVALGRDVLAGRAVHGAARDQLRRDPHDRMSRLLSDDGLVGHFARRVLPAVLAIPVLSGTLCMAAAREGWFGFEFAAWLMTLTAVAGLAVVAGLAITELAGEERRLTELAIRDPLTGAYNRRHFLTEAQHAASRAQRYGEQAAVAVVDLDHFKEINDRWGHAAGDEALVRSYRALRSRLRSSDVLGRIGGDEFAALVLHVDERGGAAGRRGDARGGRERRPRTGRGGAREPAAASVGIAPLHVDDPRDVDALIDLADQRMYLAKRAKALTE